MEPEATVQDAPQAVLHARVYGERLGDYQLVNGWWTARHGEPLHEGLLPPLGVMVEADGEAVAVLWCYECFGIGVCFLEYPITRPNLSFSLARRSMAVALEACIRVAKSHGDFSFFKAFPQTDSMTRCLRAFGFQICTPDKRGLCYQRD